MLNGKSHSGSVVNGNIHWDDGDVWERRPDHVLGTNSARKNASRARLDAREALNSAELRIARGFNTYTSSEAPEVDFLQFKQLLSKCHKTTPDNDDIEWLLRVVGKDTRMKFDYSEVVLAMTAWHAAQHVPEMVAACVQGYDVDSKGAFDRFKLQAFLCEQLNDGKLVRKEEVDHLLTCVRGTAVDVEGLIDKNKLDIPIAVWFLNVESQPGLHASWGLSCGCVGG